MTPLTPDDRAVVLSLLAGADDDEVMSTLDHIRDGSLRPKSHEVTALIDAEAVRRGLIVDAVPDR